MINNVTRLDGAHISDDNSVCKFHGQPVAMERWTLDSKANVARLAEGRSVIVGYVCPVCEAMSLEEVEKAVASIKA